MEFNDQTHKENENVNEASQQARENSYNPEPQPETAEQGNSYVPEVQPDVREESYAPQEAENTQTPAEGEDAARENLSEAPSYYGQQPEADAAPGSQPTQGYSPYMGQQGYPGGAYQPQGGYAYRAAQPKQRKIWPAVLITAVCCLLVGGLIAGLAVYMLGARGNGSFQAEEPAAAPSPTQKVRESAEGVDPNFSFEETDPAMTYVTSGGLADMAEAVTPSIVGVLNLQYQSQQSSGYYYYYGFGQAPQQQQTTEPYLREAGSGSGVIISADGYIVTNCHVVEGADALKILMNDGEEVDAVLIGSDSVTDLAVLKVEKSGLTVAALGDSDQVRVGEMAVAIGNPLGSDLAGTVTMGIISAKDRTIQVDDQYIDVLQTDAAINPGNSGGALVNQMGQVIGITSAKTVTAGYDSYGNAISAEGIGYAIPINNAKPIVEQIIRTGSVPRPALGVTVQLVTNRIDTDQKGLLVTSVVEGGSADLAGVKVNDVITHMNGQSFETLSDFKRELMKYNVGDKLKLSIARDDENIEIELTLMDSRDMETEEEEEQGNSQWAVPGFGGNYFNPFGG